LRSELRDCQFPAGGEGEDTVANIFLRAQFIRGIKDNHIREQLLQAGTEKFDDIVSKAIGLEGAKIDSKELTQRAAPQSTGTTTINKVSNSRKINHNKNNKNKGNQHQRAPVQNKANPKGRESKIDYAKLGIDGLCLRCGRDNHMVADCRSNKANLKCSECKKTGHVSKVCIRSLLEQKSNRTQNTNLVQVKTNDREYGIWQLITKIDPVTRIWNNTTLKSILKENQSNSRLIQVQGSPFYHGINS